MAAFATLLLAGMTGCSGADMTSRQQPPPNRPNTGGASGTTPAATGGSSGNGFGNPNMQPTGTAGRAQGQAPGPCKGLQCQQRTSCAGNAPTTVSGTVFDPAGSNPIYNAVVYVPNEPVLPLKSGASCDDCDSLYSGQPIAAALTDSAGKFTMPKAPVGSNIPLVVQIGKWRRQFTVPTVTACQDNPIPDGMLRLPRNRMEGDIPNIAISTGSADTLECLLRRVGVDASEYTPGHGGEGRVHIFAGTPRRGGGGGDNVVPNTSPPAPNSPTALWNSTENLMQYDIVLLSCEGEETASMNQQALHDYASAGGRVFASHFHYSWFNSGPYANENLATWSPGSNEIGDNGEVEGDIVTTLANGMPFPKGVALKEWLQNVNALQNDRLQIEDARHNADVGPTHTASQPWIVVAPGSEGAGATQYFSFNTPTDALNQADSMYCGRVVFSDLHVGAASGDDPETPVPASCAANSLSAQEAALEFMLFDLSSCVITDDVPPAPPVVE